MSYQVKFYKGDYRKRQIKANKDKCILYIEHHFNSSPDPNPNYCVTIVGRNASKKSKAFGIAYCKYLSALLDIPIGGGNGIMIGGYSGKGDYNLKFTNMPAVLLEPLFVSNPKQAQLAKSENGQVLLAQVLADNIKEFFPDGGLIGFSVGHKYKDRYPDDRGANVYGGGTEADYAEQVLLKAKDLLES